MHCLSIEQLVEAYPMILGLPLTHWAIKRIEQLKVSCEQIFRV